MTQLNFVRWAARELSPNQPIKFLVELAHCPRATAKAWYLATVGRRFGFCKDYTVKRKIGSWGIWLDSSTITFSSANANHRAHAAS